MRKYFTTKGRVNRLEFLLFSLIIISISLIGSVLLFRHAAPKYIIITFNIIPLYCYAVQCAKREHDFGNNGFWGFVFAFFMLIPLANIISIIHLYIPKGTEGVNKYGESSDFGYTKRKEVENKENNNTSKTKPKEQEIKNDEHKVLLEKITGGEIVLNLMGKTNQRLFDVLFEWGNTDVKGIIKLYYKSFRTDIINNAPTIWTSKEKKHYVEKGDDIAIFKTEFYGYVPVIAPESGMVEILVPYSKLVVGNIQIPDESFILSLDYRKETIDEYFKIQEDKRLWEEYIKEEGKKKEIAKKLLEKERKKRIYQETLQELSEKGLISSGSKNNNKSKREPIPQEVADKVWNRDGGKCVRCGSNENLEFDHIIPFSKGGSSSYRNLQLLCQKCNRSKSDKIG